MKRTLLPFLGLLVLFAGCKSLPTYPGPRRPSSEVALVKCERRADVLPFGQLVMIPVTWIESVDGYPVTSHGPRMEVLAGKRQIQFGYRYLEMEPKSVLREVELEAGETYRLELEGRRDEAHPVLRKD